MDGYVVEFIPLDWIERACAWPGLVVYSRPVVIERRSVIRRVGDGVEKLLRTLLEASNAHTNR